LSKIRTLNDLRPTEATTPHRQKQIMNLILRAGFWTTPIVVDKNSDVIMDGHHRYQCAQALGFHSIPVIEMCYTTVRVEARRMGFDVSPSEIYRRAISGDLYPPKTTRHIFPREIEPCNVPLSALREPEWNKRCVMVWQSTQQCNARSMEAAE